MNRRVYGVVVVALAILLGLHGCAKTTDVSFEEKELRSMEAWMSLYVNVGGVEVAEKIREGMYLEWLNGPGGGTKPEAGDWLEINYEGMTFERERYSNIFMTRSKQTAKQLKSFSGYTHYVPHYLHYEKNSMMLGQFLAIEKMGLGDKVRLYLASELTTGLGRLTFNNGYGGQYSVPDGRLMIIDMELVDIVADPEADEQNKVEARATDLEVNGGLELWLYDTIRKGLYLKVVEYELDDEKRDTVKVDSTVTIQYVGRFLDGFIFDTNVPAIGDVAERDTLNYANLVYTPKKVTDDDEEEGSSDALILAFSRVFTSGKVTYDSKIIILTSSVYAYGVSGQNAGTVPYTVIQPYSPLIFEITVLPKEVDED